MKILLNILILLISTQVVLAETTVEEDLQKIKNNAAKNVALQLCDREKILSCIGTTRKQCLSAMPKISELCITRHMITPDEYQSKGSDEKVQYDVNQGVKYGYCLLEDYSASNGKSVEQIKECISRSNN